VLDRAGRLQIPRDFIDSLGMKDRVLVALEPDHVGVWPDAVRDPGRDPGRTPERDPGRTPERDPGRDPGRHCGPGAGQEET
jgi:putative ABC transport system ATP-binding protein